MDLFCVKSCRSCLSSSTVQGLLFAINFFRSCCRLLGGCFFADDSVPPVKFQCFFPSNSPIIIPVKPVLPLMFIPGVGFWSALTLYAEICDFKWFSSAWKLAHYAGLVHRVSQSGEHSFTGREARGDCWLKCIFIESAWSHVRFCPEGHLAQVFRMLLLGKAIVRMRLRLLLVSL